MLVESFIQSVDILPVNTCLKNVPLRFCQRSMFVCYFFGKHALVFILPLWLQFVYKSK